MDRRTAVATMGGLTLALVALASALFRAEHYGLLPALLCVSGLVVAAYSICLWFGLGVVARAAGGRPWHWVAAGGVLIWALGLTLSPFRPLSTAEKQACVRAYTGAVLVVSRGDQGGRRLLFHVAADRDLRPRLRHQFTRAAREPMGETVLARVVAACGMRRAG